MATRPDSSAPPPAPGGTTFAGRQAFVAGATGLVGTAVADMLAALGADVVVHAGRAEETARTLAKDLADRYGVSTVPVQADLTDDGQVAALPERLAVAGVTGVDVVVSCVTGFGGRPAPLPTLDVAEFRRVLDVDLVGPYALVRILLEPLRARRGHIVLLGSLAGERGRPAAAHLCAAKAGVSGLVRALSRELRPAGLTVNAVAPGPVVADGDAVPPGLPPGVAVSTPQDVARVVTFAASAANTGLDGQVLVVEGTYAGAVGPEGGR